MKIVWILLGTLSLGIGCIGIILPLLPSFPFFLLTLYCYTKSSEKLRKWFISTSIYQKHLEYYLTHKAMNKKMKIKIMIIVTILISFGFMMMSSVFIGRIILVGVWLFHLYYFIFKIKTRDI